MTSIPESRNARAMTFAPRSWPSRPGFAIKTRMGRSGMRASLSIRPEKGARARNLYFSRGTLFLFRDSQDPVVLFPHPPSAVPIAGRDVEGAVGAAHHLSQTSVLSGKEVLDERDAPWVLRCEADPDEPLAPQRREKEVAGEGGKRRPPRERRARRGDCRRELEQRRDEPR